MEITSYHVAAFAHVAFLAIGFGAVIVIDTFGLLWLFKKVQLELVDKVATITQRLIWLGWGGLVLTGAYMLIQKGSISNITALKLFFVALLGVNGINLHFIKKSFAHYLSSSLIPKILYFRMGLASTISQLGWWGAIVIGFLNVRFPGKITGPMHPEYFMVGILALILIVALGGQTVLKKNND
jgi:hypothetical protein